MFEPLKPFDVAVLIRTILRPALLDAVRSIYRQDFPGRVQIVVGIDAVPDHRRIIRQLQAECPTSIRLDILILPYPTSQSRGGLYSSRSGGILQTMLAYFAHARHCVFLDDDNWAAPDHLRLLRDAVEGFDWAFTLRWFAEERTRRVLCVDEWESVGPGRGAFSEKLGGFVDPNCMIFDKLACHFAIPWTAHAFFPDRSGSDRLFFGALRDHHSVGWTGRPTVYYVIHPGDEMEPYRKAWMAERGVAI